MRTEIFDDGSRVTYDENGAIVGGVDAEGNALRLPPPEGSAIVQQFANLFHNGILAALDRKIRPAAAAAPGTAASAAVPSPAMQAKTIMLFAVGLTLAVLLLKK